MINNIFYKTRKFFLLLIIILLLISLVSCKHEEPTKYDTENDPLNIGFITKDLKVSPFFISSSVEKEICSYMFSSFLTLGVDGEIKYGEDYNTVVKSMEKYYENENHNKSDEFKEGYHPVYEFVIKEGMKFSDNVEITYDDVLFNLYTYLDPAYDGLNTLYTLPIKGLDEYTTQISKSNLEIYKTIGEELKADYIAQNGKYLGSKRAYTYDEWCEYEEVLKNKFYYYFKLLVQNSDDDKSLSKEIMSLEHILAYYLDKVGLALNYLEATSETTGYVYYEGFKYPLKQYKNGDYVIVKNNDKYEIINLLNATTEEQEQYKSLTRYALDKRSDDLFYSVYDKEGIQLNDYNDLYNFYIKVYTSKSGTIEFEKLIDKEFSKYTNSNAFFKEVLNAFIIKENDKNSTVADSINSISGISVVKIDGVDTLRIELTEEDNTILEKLTFFVAPKHYYTAGYNGQFRLTNYGVPLNKQDFIAHLKTFNYTPVGSGPYKMIFDGNYKNDGFISLERNKYFETMKGKDSTSNNIKNANIKYLNIYALDNGSEYEALNSGKVSYIKTSLNKNLANKLTMNYGIALTDSLSYGSIVIDANVIENQNERKALQSVMDISKVFDYYPENTAKLIEYNSSSIYGIYPTSTKVSSEYDETLAKAIMYFELAGYEFNKDTNTFDVSPSYVFYLDSKESDSPFGEILYNAVVLLESVGISARIETGIKRQNAIYSVYACDNYCPVDFDLTYKFTIDRFTSSDINAMIHNLYSKGYDNTLGIGMYNVSSLNTKLNQAMAIEHINLLISGLNNITDEAKQKEAYEEILKAYNELAIEVPVYQAYDLYVYDYSVINERSLSATINFSFSPLAEIWKVTYCK